MATGKKFSFGSKLSSDAKKKEAGVVGYAGEKPPEGAYVFRLRRFFMDKDKGGDKMAYLAEIDDPRPKMEQFKGYPVWGGQHINDQAAGYLNQMLRAFANGSDRLIDGFYDSNGSVGTKIEETKNGNRVYHIRTLGDESIKVEEVKFVGICRDNKFTKNGKTTVNLQISGYVPLSESPLGDGVSVGKEENEEDYIEEDEETENDADSDEITDADDPDGVYEGEEEEEDLFDDEE